MLVLDAGAFVAAERGDRDLAVLLKIELLAGRAPRTHGGVVGQIWRGGFGKQVNVARLLRATEVAPLDEPAGKRAGMLLTRSKTTDVIDGAVVLLATDGDTILTSDVRDLLPLASAAGLHVDLVRV